MRALLIAHNSTVAQSIDFEHLDRELGGVALQPFHPFVGANYLVSIHEQPLPEVVDSMARWQLKNGPLQPKIGAAVDALLGSGVDEYFPLMDQIADRGGEL